MLVAMIETRAVQRVQRLINATQNVRTLGAVGKCARVAAACHVHYAARARRAAAHANANNATVAAAAAANKAISSGIVDARAQLQR